MTELFPGWRRKVGVQTLMMACLLMVGCDPVRTTNQSVTITVLDRETKVPIGGATVQMKHAWMSVHSDPQLDKIDKKNWEAFSWHQGLSDSEGRVVINIVITALDWNRGSTPPPKRDTSGVKFLTKISINESSEELEIPLNSLATGDTERFSFEIAEIGPVKYENPWEGHIGNIKLGTELAFICGCFWIMRVVQTRKCEIRRMIWTLQCRESRPRKLT